MATLRQVFNDIANAIRKKTNKVGKILPTDMAKEIETINIKEQPPYTINHFYPAIFRGAILTDEELREFLKDGGTEGLYTSMGFMFDGCKNLTTIPNIDISNVTGMYGMFQNCKKLKAIPAFDVNKVTDLGSIFSNCIEVEEINMININANLDIHWCAKMQQPALHKVIDNLMQTTTTKTLTMGATLLERVSPEYKQKAQNKGWTLA